MFFFVLPSDRVQEIHLDDNSEVTFCDMPNPSFGIQLIADGKVSAISEGVLYFYLFTVACTFIYCT